MDIIKNTVIICLCFILTGCSCKKENITTIKFSTWGSASEMKILTPIISDFEKENPNIRIELIHIPQDYFKKLHLLIASNLAPDVMFINNLNLPRYKNYLLDLSSYIKSTDYFYQSLNGLRVEDKLYAVPRDVSVLMIYYNKDIFKKYNVSYPDKSWSMDDLINKSKILTKNGRYGISFDDDVYYAIPYMHYYGGGILSESQEFIAKSEPSQKGINLYKGLAYKYHIAPTLSQRGSKTSAQMFLEGNLAMHLSGRWLVPKYRQTANFDWDIVNFPHSSAPCDVSGWAISKNSKNKDAALKFVMFLSSKQNIEKMVKSGLIVPARVDVAYSKEFLNNSPKNSELFLYAVKTSKPTIVSKDYNRLTDKLSDEIFQTVNK